MLTMCPPDPSLGAPPPEPTPNALPQPMGGEDLLHYARTLNIRAAQVSAAHLQGAGIMPPDSRVNHLEDYRRLLATDRSGSTPVTRDYLPFMTARIYGTDPMRLSDEIARGQTAIASSLHRRIAFLSHTGNRARPVDFYDSYPELRDAMACLGCPVIIAAENSVFTLVSINPVTSLMAADVLKRTLTASLGYVPFVSPIITSLQRWEWLCQNHFQP